MKKLLLILLCLPIIGFGQGWEQTFGGTNQDFGTSGQQTSDGGYIITGRTYSFGNGVYDVYLIKTDGNGNELWTKTFGGIANDVGFSVQQTSDGGYIITGHTTSFGNGAEDVYLIKTDGNGNELWTKTFGGILIDEGVLVQQTNDGGYIITGHTTSFGNGLSDVYLIKTDVNGDSLWTKTFGSTTNDFGLSVQQTSDGGYIITGTFEFYDVYLIKTDSNGNELWTKTFGGVDNDIGFSVQQTSDGGYIISGRTFSFGNGLSDVYIIKTDGNGNELWTKTFGGSGNDEGAKIQQTSDGGYILTGYTEAFQFAFQDVYLIKTDGNGDSLWTKKFGGTFNDVGVSVQQTSDGGYIIFGWSGSFGNGAEDVYLIKTDGNGNVSSTFNIPTTSKKKLKKIVDILGREIVPKSNRPFIEIYDDGSVEKKIIIE